MCANVQTTAGPHRQALPIDTNVEHGAQRGIIPMGSDEWSALASGLAQRAGAGADAACIAETLTIGWQDMEAALRPIVGAGGVAALGARSLSIVAASHPWLSGATGGESAALPLQVDLAVLGRRVAQQHSAEAAAGSAALLQAFHELLCSLIGAVLGERLLRSVWQVNQPAPAGPVR